ncbi:hypothetical protein ACQ4PT_050010 [Festuca glaucescens]
MPAGTSLTFDPLLVDDSNAHYRLRVYPAGFDEESADFIIVFVHTGGAGTCERTVLDNHTAFSGQALAHRGSSRGYVRFVRRREMEASSCVSHGDDSFVVRCTVSIHAEVSKQPHKVFVADQAMSVRKPEAKTIMGSHTITINCFSKVYPNGRCDASRGCVSVFLGCGRSDEPAKNAKFAFEIVGLPKVSKVEFMMRTFDRSNPEHGFPYLVTCTDLASIQDMIDCLVVRCHLCVWLEHHPKVTGIVTETENK